MENLVQHISSEIPFKKYLCVHAKNKYTCKDCKGSCICIHNLYKYRCKDCVKDLNCKHRIKKTDCGDCKNIELVCKHNNIKSNCFQCTGKLCSHGRQKAYCKDCGGSQFCNHGKRKAICIDCKGSQLCTHNNVKYECLECKGASICIHNKKKHCCKECNGKLYCEHGITKSYCKTCKGSSICIHNNIKKRCIDCKGSQICEHNTIRNTCKSCKGSQICKHTKLKYFCKECDGRNLCKSSWCHTSGINKYNGYCFQCTIHLFPEIKVSRDYKTKEQSVIEFIQTTFPDVSWIKDKKIVDGCSGRRPDLLLDMGTHILIIEIDENQHNSYDCTCENKRLMEISQDNNHRPIVFIRFNPDSYINSKNEKISSCWTSKTDIVKLAKNKLVEWQTRLTVLKEHIEYWIAHINKKMIEVIELYYDSFIN